MLGVWSPAGGAILGCSGNFKRWDIARKSRSLEAGAGGILS
jgi:hypothetical protein